MVPGLDQLAWACETHGAELLVDVYHALGVMSFPLDGLESAWVVGGGYVPAARRGQLLPARAASRRRAAAAHKLVAEFAGLAAEKTAGAVEYPKGGMRGLRRPDEPLPGGTRLRLLR